jgi:hypothetical protein
LTSDGDRVASFIGAGIEFVLFANVATGHSDGRVLHLTIELFFCVPGPELLLPKFVIRARDAEAFDRFNRIENPSFRMPVFVFFAGPIALGGCRGAVVDTFGPLTVAGCRLTLGKLFEFRILVERCVVGRCGLRVPATARRGTS